MDGKTSVKLQGYMCITLTAEFGVSTDGQEIEIHVPSVYQSTRMYTHGKDAGQPLPTELMNSIVASTAVTVLREAVVGALRALQQEAEMTEPNMLKPAEPS